MIPAVLPVIMYVTPRRSSRSTNGAIKLAVCTQEDPAHVLGDLAFAPVGMPLPFSRSTQQARGPVELVCLTQPFRGRHRAIATNLLGGRTIHGRTVARASDTIGGVRCAVLYAWPFASVA